MRKVIIVTGASSGFGALAARQLAANGDIVYASMRETKGRADGGEITRLIRERLQV